MSTSTDVEMRPEDIAAAVGVPVGALAITGEQTQLTEAQRDALAFIGIDKAPESAVEAFLHLCQRTQLDPWAKQIYLIERAGKWTPQTGIDGFRVIAERRDEYAGTTDILWCADDGVWTDVWLSKKEPHAARCSAKRHDRDDPITATVLFAEFTAGNAKWKTSPAHMIGKCAEAGALRRAFPQDFAGLVIDEEAQALTAQARRTRVEAVREDRGPVDPSELTGKPGPAKSPRRRNELAGGTERMTQAHQRLLFEAIRTADGLVERGGSKEWAGQVLGKTVRSWAPLTCDEANLLIGKLAAGDLSTGQEAEVVDETPADAPDTGDDVEDAYRQIEAERDAAQGQLGDDGGAG